MDEATSKAVCSEVLGRMTENSSPPMREQVSIGLVALRMAFDTFCRIWSPN